MDFNRCSRCGAFYISENSGVCPNCQPKDNCEKIALQNYLEENQMPNSMEILSKDTGISVKNLNRFVEDNDIKFQL